MNSIGVPKTTPAGGATADALIKATDADYDTGWGPIAAGGPPSTPVYVSGRWYDNRAFPEQSSTKSIAAGSCFYMPFYLPQSLPITALGIYATAAPPAGLVCNLAINAAAASGVPAALIVAPQAVSPTVVGRATATLPATVTLPAGWLWAAVGASATVTLAAVSVFATRTPMGNPGGPVNSYPIVGYIDSTGAVPKASPGGTAQATNTVPLLWYRAA